MLAFSQRNDIPNDPLSTHGMTLTKTCKLALVGLIVLSAGGPWPGYDLGLMSGSDQDLCLNRQWLPSARAQSGVTSAKTASKKSSKVAGAEKQSEPEVTQEIAALWGSPSSGFAAAFAKVGQEPRELSIENIRNFIGSGRNALFGISLGGQTGSQTEQQAASYALARILTRGKNSQPTPDERKEALALYSQSAALNCLHLPSLWRTAEIITALGDESETRAVLGKISEDPAAGESDRARAQYEIAQSFMRAPPDQSQQTGQTTNPNVAAGTISGTSQATSQGTNQGNNLGSNQGLSQSPSQVANLSSGQTNSASTEQARTIFLAIREKYPTSEYAKGACYYLAQMALADAGGIIPERVYQIEHFRALLGRGCRQAAGPLPAQHRRCVSASDIELGRPGTNSCGLLQKRRFNQGPEHL